MPTESYGRYQCLLLDNNRKIEGYYYFFKKFIEICLINWILEMGTLCKKFGIMASKIIE